MKRRRGQSKLGNFTVGTAVIAVLCALTWFGFTKSIPFREHFEIEAVFPSANNIRPNSPVRIAGVNVGKVTGIEHVQGGRQAAVVRMRIDDKGLPIHKDATLKIRPRIFLEGNFFIDVNPGSPSAPKIGDGDRIPINQTAAPVQIDQVLSALQTDTREDLKLLLRELASGLKGEGGEGYNRSIPYWQPAYQSSAVVSDALRGRLEHDLSRYIEGAGAFAEGLDRNSGQLKSLITDFNTTARAFASEDADLQAALRELPRTLRAAQPALRELNASFPAVRRLIADARPAVRSSGPAIDATLPFARQVRRLVGEGELRGLARELRPVVPSLAALNQRSVPLYDQVRAASSCQNEVILPWSKDKLEDDVFPARGPVYQEATKPLPGLAGESRSGDANGQWFRVLLSAPQYAYPMGTDRFFLTGNPIQGVNPPVPKGHKRSPLRPDVPCETQQQPDLRTKAGAAPQGFRINPSDSDAAKKFRQDAVEDTVDWLRDRLKAEGSDLRVSDEPATLDVVKNLGGGR